MPRKCLIWMGIALVGVGLLQAASQSHRLDPAARRSLRWSEQTCRVSGGEWRQSGRAERLRADALESHVGHRRPGVVGYDGSPGKYGGAASKIGRRNHPPVGSLGTMRARDMGIGRSKRKKIGIENVTAKEKQ